jgi:hypothetical protein
MRTIFLLCILGALIVIATKRNDQTTIEAAMEIGQKAQSLVTEYDRAKETNRAPRAVENLQVPDSNNNDPFIRQTKEALTKARDTLSRKVKKPETIEKSEQASNLAAPSLDRDSKALTDNSGWTAPKPGQVAIPDIPAMPKASVEKVDLGAETTIKVANIQQPAIDEGQSYDLVKGYYENASRLLEEIK